MKPRFGFSVFFLFLASSLFIAESKCTNACGLALASYYIWEGSNPTYIAQIMESEVVSGTDDIVSYNGDTVPSKDYIKSTSRVNVPFPCDCIEGEFLGHIFQYSLTPGETYTSIATGIYSNLTTEDSLQSFNSYRPTNIPDSGKINVTVNCYCGNSDVSMDYGLFITYPLRPEDTLQSITNATNLNAELLQRYNPGVNFSQGSGLVYIPGKGTC